MEQVQHWDDLHTGPGTEPVPDGPSALARETARLLRPRSRVLELGCGTGTDAAYLAAHGHDVLALDFSAVAIRRAAARHAEAGVDFRVADHSRPLELPSGGFDLVYSRLSLHYFTDEVTRALAGEIARVLVPRGRLVALCRSVADPLWGRGTRLGDDMYRLDGHVRRFFSAASLRDVLGREFREVRVTEFEGPAYGRPSAFVQVAARRR